jgi:hypothetical protein
MRNKMIDAAFLSALFVACVVLGLTLSLGLPGSIVIGVIAVGVAGVAGHMVEAD